jgi:hypothetical protein
MSQYFATHNCNKVPKRIDCVIYIPLKITFSPLDCSFIARGLHRESHCVEYTLLSGILSQKFFQRFFRAKIIAKFPRQESTLGGEKVAARQRTSGARAATKCVLLDGSSAHEHAIAAHCS